ncbi:MAG TPA: ABC transporter permease [Vicinamibacterales bacterium]|nr:ABC transporter permease [Vicinamibacterales bacterium]
MRFVLTSAIKDLRRRVTDPAALLMWLGLPIVIGGLMSLINGGNGPVPKAHLMVVDEDQSLVSQLMIGGSRQGRLAEFLDVELVTADVGRARIDKGDGTALLTIPKGFQDSVLREQPATLALVKNPAERILPVIIEEGLKMLVEAVFYVQRIFGVQLREIADSIGSGTRPSSEGIAAVSRAFNDRLRTVEATLFPPVLALEARKAPQEPQLNFWALFFPGLLFMSLMFTAQGMSIDIWIEKTGGTLRRVLSTPQRVAAFLLGKLAASVVIMVLAVIVALVLGVTMFDVPIARAPAALIWAAYAGGALFSFLVLIQVFASSTRGGQFLSSMIVFPLIMIGGSFFPFEVMPAWMARIGRWTPNGLGVANMKEILFGHPDPAALAIAAIAIGAPAALALWIAARRLRGAFAVNG